MFGLNSLKFKKNESRQQNLFYLNSLKFKKYPFNISMI